MNLPPGFLDYMIQWQAMNALPTAPHTIGYEIGYDQITAGVNVDTSETTIIAGSSYAFDGNPVLLEFFSPDVLLPSVAVGAVSLDLFDGATQLNTISVLTNAAAAAVRNPVYLAYRFTPTAGSHTYAIKARASSITGTPAVQAGSGTVSSGLPPSFLRFTKI